MAGYSGTPLPKKLGIKDGSKVLVVGEAPKTLGIKSSPKAARYDVIVVFVTERAELAKQFKAQLKVLEQNGGLWAAWPKKSSGVKTDITEDTVRAVALPMGLVDNKVCAIDETWSGLRCVIRLENRK
ncbi:MAG: DUF3052 domain-containing protein [Archangium sp.]